MSKTVRESIDFLKEQIESPMSAMVAELVVESLHQTLGEDILDKELDDDI